MNPNTDFSFTYELTSKQIRLYTINDLSSIGRALHANVQEYLEWLGFGEKRPISTKEFLFAMFTVCCAVVFFCVTSVSYLGIFDVLCLATFILCFVPIFYYRWRHQLEDLAFHFNGSICRDDAPDWVKRFEGRPMCIFIRGNQYSPVIEFEARLIKDAGFFTGVETIASVKKSVQYGKYFGSTGFFYSPPFVKDVDDLLNDLSRVDQKKKD